MKNLKISSLLYGIIGITNLLLIILIGINYFSLNTIKKDFFEYKIHTDKMDLYSSIQTNTLRMRIQAKDILIEDAPAKKVQRFEKFNQKTLKRLNEAIKVSSLKTKEKLIKIKNDINKYSDEITHMVRLIKKNSELFKKVGIFEEDFKTNLKNVIDNEDDLLEALSAFLNTQIELMKYKSSMSKEEEEIIEKDLNIIQNELGKIKSHLKRLNTITQKYQELTEDYTKYKNLVENIIKNISEIKEHLTTTSAIGHDVTVIAQELKIEKRKDLTILEKDLIKNINSTITTTVIISLIILLIISTLLYIISKIIINDIKLITNFLSGDTSDLTRRMQIDSNNEIAQIANSINAFVSKMQEALIKVKDVSNNVNSATNMVNKNVNTIEINISKEHNTVLKATNLTDISKNEVENVNIIIDKMHKMADDSLLKLQQSVEKIVLFIENIKETSSRDLEVANKVIGLKDSTQQVKDVMNIISEIADQTNLLALNAAIEAARAGEHGRGFAVVADEVRNLAEKTQNSLNEINNTINLLLKSVEEIANEIQNNVEVIQKVSDDAGVIETNVEDVLNSLKETKTLSDETAEKSDKLTKIIEDISAIMANIKSISDLNDSSAKEIENVTNNLKNKVKELENEINNFKL